MEDYDVSTPEKFESFLQQYPEFDTPRQRRILESRKKTASFLHHMQTENQRVMQGMVGDKGAAVRALLNDEQDEALRILLKNKSLDDVLTLMKTKD